MKSDLIAIYAELTALNTYEKPQIKDLINRHVNREKVSFVRIESTPIETVSGYQGHIYRNTSTGDIIVVHEGSIPLGEMFKHKEEVKKVLLGGVMSMVI